jgi:hypothetical protein
MMDWGSADAVQEQITALCPAGMGLMEAVGKGLKAIEDVIARPDVQNGLMMIVNGIVALAQNAAAYLPTAINGFFQIIDFLRNNQGVVSYSSCLGAHPAFVLPLQPGLQPLPLFQSF